MRIDSATSGLASLTGSFTGSFFGDGSGLTNLQGISGVAILYPSGWVSSSSQVDFGQLQNKPTLVSSSAQVSFTDISDKPTNFTGSFNELKDKPTLVSGSQQILDLVVLDEDTFTSNSDTKVPTQQSTKVYVDTAISDLVDSSPATLDTLNELAAALGDDPNFATTITNTMSGKVSQSLSLTAGNGLTGGGDLTTDRTFAVGAGNGITVNANDIALATSVAGDGLAYGAGGILNVVGINGITANANDITLSSTVAGSGLGLAAGGILNIGAGTGVTVNANDIEIGQDVATSADVQFDSLGIGTAAPGTTGVIRATNDIVAYYSSDERLKDNITPLTGALDKVNKLGGYEFDWNSNQEVHTGHDIGVIAQEVEAQYPELVHDRDNGYKAVDYVKLTAVLIEAVKELSEKVRVLENK